MKLFKKISILGLVVLLNLGCSKETYHKDISLERDGEISSIYLDELDNTVKSENNVQFSISRLNNNYTYIDTNILVDNNMYNFLIVYPFKTKTNLIETYKHIPDAGIAVGTGYGLSLIADKDDDEYYHYKLYKSSNFLASMYALNDIKDSTIYLDYKKNTIGEDIRITSNKLTIPAEEFEEMLERLAISHERLAFQPEGY